MRFAANRLAPDGRLLPIAKHCEDWVKSDPRYMMRFVLIADVLNPAKNASPSLIQAKDIFFIGQVECLL